MGSNGSSGDLCQMSMHKISLTDVIDKNIWTQLERLIGKDGDIPPPKQLLPLASDPPIKQVLPQSTQLKQAITSNIRHLTINPKNEQIEKHINEKLRHNYQTINLGDVIGNDKWHEVERLVGIENKADSIKAPAKEEENTRAPKCLRRVQSAEASRLREIAEQKAAQIKAEAARRRENAEQEAAKNREIAEYEAARPRERAVRNAAFESAKTVRRREIAEQVAAQERAEASRLREIAVQKADQERAEAARRREIDEQRAVQVRAEADLAVIKIRDHCIDPQIQKLYFFIIDAAGPVRDWDASPDMLHNWPRLVKLEWILCDNIGNELAAASRVIKPNGFIIPTKSSRFHGITTERALAEGVSLCDVLDEAWPMIKAANCAISHHISLNEKILGAEYLRLGRPYPFSAIMRCCTMETSVDFCAIPGLAGRFLSPSLTQLSLKLFPDRNNGVNRPSVQICKAAYFELRKRGIIAQN